MRIVVLIASIIFFSLPVASQNMLSGKVLDSLTREPIQYVNVFFANTSIGSVTDAHGEFEIRDFPSGKYDLTVSFVGYTTVQQPIKFDGEVINLAIYLTQQVTQLKEITVQADTSGWKQNLEYFKWNFLGLTRNASQTRVINPHVLNLYFDQDDKILVAHAKQPIEIENHALGYKIYYLLEDFKVDYRSGKLDYYGIPRFSSMVPTRKGELKRWTREQERAYYGSFTHFIKSFKQNQLTENGFEVHTLFKVPNRDRPSDAYLDERIKSWQGKQTSNPIFIVGSVEVRDSLTYYMILRSRPKLVDSVGYKITDTRPLFSADDNSILQYSGMLQVTFDEREEARYALGRQPLKKQRSVVHLLGKQLRIYDNGYYEDVRNVFLDGYWAWSEKIAELLPLDYEPSIK